MLVLLMSRRSKDGKITAALKMKGDYESSFGYFPGTLTDSEYAKLIKDEEVVLFMLGFSLVEIVDRVKFEAARRKITDPG